MGFCLLFYYCRIFQKIKISQIDNLRLDYYLQMCKTSFVARIKCSIITDNFVRISTIVQTHRT